MVRVLHLLEGNPIWEKEEQGQKNNRLYRFLHLGKGHAERVRGFEKKVTKRERKSAYVAQCALAFINQAMIFSMCRHMGLFAGSKYLVAVKLGLGTGMMAGIYNGVINKTTSAQQRLNNKAKVYACYQNCFKKHQVVQEIIQSSFSVAMELTLFKLMPRYAYVSAAMHSAWLAFNISSYVTHSLKPIGRIFTAEPAPDLV